MSAQKAVSILSKILPTEDAQALIKELLEELVPGVMSPYVIGENYFIRTVTFHYTGRLIAIYPNEIVLACAAWIADDGRFADALKTGIFQEVEPYPPENLVVIGRGAIVDATILNTPLPTQQK